MNPSLPTLLQQGLLPGCMASEKNPKTLVFGIKSEVSKAFDKFYSGQKDTPLPEKYTEVKQKHASIGEGYRRMETITDMILEALGKDVFIVEIGGSVHQQRSGRANEKFPNYFPLDISEENMIRYSDQFGKYSFAANAEHLPFKDNSVDCILTHTFLEHPTHPEKVIREIIRVVKPGGWVIHNDAWFCRWWQRYGVVGLKRFSSMSAKEKLISVGATITEFPIFRMPPILLRRIWRQAIPSNALRYAKLQPNYQLQLGCDEDAASSLDPVEVIQFYERHGFKTRNHLGYITRLLHRNEPVFLIKDNSTVNH